MNVRMFKRTHSLENKAVKDLSPGLPVPLLYLQCVCSLTLSFSPPHTVIAHRDGQNRITYSLNTSYITININ